jgi:hypothetical protein
MFSQRYIRALTCISCASAFHANYFGPAKIINIDVPIFCFRNHLFAALRPQDVEWRSGLGLMRSLKLNDLLEKGPSMLHSSCREIRT